MANFCGFDMKIAGPEAAVRELVDMLSGTGAFEGNRLGRVFSFDLDESLTEKDPLGGDNISVQGFGDCAWSIKSSLREGRGYLRTLDDEVERLGLVVEVYSSEPGERFQEHLLLAKDEIIEDECVHYEEYVIDGATEEYIQELLAEKHITREQLMAKVNHNGEYTVGGFPDYCDFKNLFSYFDVPEKPSLADQIARATEKAAGTAAPSHKPSEYEKG